MDNFVKYEISSGGAASEQKGACVGGDGVSNTFTTGSIDVGSKLATHYVIAWYTNAVSGGTMYWYWKLQGSANNSSWTDIACGQKSAAKNTSGYGTIENSLSTTYRYYRLQFSQSGPGSVQSTGSLTIMYS